MTEGRPRVAFLLPDMRGGGAERVALQLIGDFIASGVDVDLVLLETSGELLALLPPEVRVFDLEAARLRKALRPFIGYLRREQPDAVHALMWPLTVIAILAHRLSRSRARMIVSDHSTLSRQYAGSGHRRMGLLKSSIRLFYPLADARVIVSEGAADDLATLSGLDRRSIDVIYNPVPQPPPPTADSPSLDAIWGSGTARILTVGTLKEEKNHILIIRAFARLARRRPATLVIVGDGPMRARLAEAAAEEGVAQQVLLPGFTTDPWPYYRSADLFVLSSEFEGYPLVLVEAMRCGVQVVSTDCQSGPDEILAGGEYGTLVPCGHAGALAGAIEERLRHPITPALLQARAEELSGARSSERYLELMLGFPPKKQPFITSRDRP